MMGHTQSALLPDVERALRLLRDNGGKRGPRAALAAFEAIVKCERRRLFGDDKRPLPPNVVPLFSKVRT